MPTRLLAFVCGLAVLAIMALAFEDANAAARFGGGRSFGGKPSMSRPFSKPVPPASSTMRQQTNQAQQPGAAAAAAPGRSGLFGGMGGMLGGLLAGGLIGSLLFGGGMGGMGGGLLDLLLIAAVLYFGFKFFARRRAASTEAAAGAAAGSGGGGFSGNQAEPHRAPDLRETRYQAPSASSPAPRGGMDWGSLAGKPIPMAAPEGALANTVKVPAGFDEEDFLSGAKAAYARLNSSWDKGDLDDIAQFSTPAFMNEIRDQAAEREESSRTDIMLINASLVEVETVDAEQIASVYFSVLLREDPKADAPVDVREVWHFVRPASGEGSWLLDGIQQVEGA